MDPRVEADAREFGLHVKQGGWRLGLLVARSVEKNAGDGVNRDDEGVTTVTHQGKVSAREFARRSGTSAPRVLRYLTAWNKAASKRHVLPAAVLTPGRELIDLDAEKLPPWSDFYDARPNPTPPPAPEPTPTVEIPEQTQEEAEAAEAVKDMGRDRVNEISTPQADWEDITFDIRRYGNNLAVNAPLHERLLSKVRSIPLAARDKRRAWINRAVGELIEQHEEQIRELRQIQRIAAGPSVEEEPEQMIEKTTTPVSSVWDPITSPNISAPTDKSATTFASSKPSATPSPSPPRRKTRTGSPSFSD